MTYQAIQSLPDVPLDIIGDVHGEFSALQSLLHHLRYDSLGYHPNGRIPVFVGDLCDRGGDSPAVLDWFRQSYEAGFAKMVLGNHELNLLVGDAKDGSGWFFDSRRDKDAERYAPWRRIAEEARLPLTQWLAQMPVTLARGDIRIVHAAWLPEQIGKLARYADCGLVEQYRRWEGDLQKHLETADWYPDYLREQQEYAEMQEDAGSRLPFLSATSAYDLAKSSHNPLRALTCGTERRADTPFYASGRWRFTSRNAWWDDYTGETAVVIGHYWRNWYDGFDRASQNPLFPERPDAWLGRRRNVFCVDYSAGARWRERLNAAPGKPKASRCRLAALRWPEKTLMFDNGEQAGTYG